MESWNESYELMQQYQQNFMAYTNRQEALSSSTSNNQSQFMNNNVNANNFQAYYQQLNNQQSIHLIQQQQQQHQQLQQAQYNTQNSRYTQQQQFQPSTMNNYNCQPQATNVLLQNNPLINKNNLHYALPTVNNQSQSAANTTFLPYNNNNNLAQNQSIAHSQLVDASNQFYPNISCNQFQNYDFSNTKPNRHAYVPIEAQYLIEQTLKHGSSHYPNRNNINTNSSSNTNSMQFMLNYENHLNKTTNATNQFYTNTGSPQEISSPLNDSCYSTNPPSIASSFSSIHSNSSDLSSPLNDHIYETGADDGYSFERSNFSTNENTRTSYIDATTTTTAAASQSHHQHYYTTTEQQTETNEQQPVSVSICWIDQDESLLSEFELHLREVSKQQDELNLFLINPSNSQNNNRT